MDLKNNLDNKIAFLTGINGGIGKEIARKLLDNNVRIIGLTSHIKKKKNILFSLEEHKNLVEIYACDLSNNKSVDRVCHKVIEKYGYPDFIINNAASLELKDLEKFNVNEINSAFQINILSPIQICKTFIPGFKARKFGSIINICSSSAYSGGGTSGHTVYSSTKHALLGFSRALDEEVRKLNIRVGTISPAGVATDMVKNRTDLDQNSMMSTEEVAEAVIYLLKSQGKGIIYEMRMWRMLR